MSQLLKGKTALVTGSTSGIGLGIAIGLAKQGANIVLNGFGDHHVAQTQIEQLGVQALYHGADVSKAKDIEDLFGFAESNHANIDILVNNAGIQYVANIEDFPVERWDSIIQTCVALHEEKKLGTHHQYRIRSWARRFCSKSRLCGCQTRHCWTHQGHRFRERHLRHHLQRHLPRLGANTLGSKTTR